MAKLLRYAALISYSSGDAHFATRLHKALESYTIPASLGAFDLIGSGKKNRIYPVFRDCELSAGRLGERIEAALEASAALTLVCSPPQHGQAPGSRGRSSSSRVSASATGSSPSSPAARHSSTPPGSTLPPLLPALFAGGALAYASALEPLAAGAREGKDGFRGELLKLVAGMIGVTLGQITGRDRKRRRQRRGSHGGRIDGRRAREWTAEVARYSRCAVLHGERPH